jgi:hypothetical protein
MPATAPYAVITSSDRSGQLQVVAIATLSLALVSVGLRVYVSKHLRSSFAFYKDDVLCFTAAVRLRQRAAFNLINPPPRSSSSSKPP